jgi:NAD(P)-dependent dehydrogenase (short-subunit alcohol dehydrogenase family)
MNPRTDEEKTMQELREKVAVVTGAASGIGLGLTERFLEEGMKVVMADIEETVLEREITRLSEQGGDVLGVLCDVRNPDDVKALAERTLSHFGGVHVLCNNAGVAPAGPMLDTSPADWQWVVDVNILGVAYGVTTFGPIMVEAGEGHIVNTASEAGLATNAALGMYCTSKHAVVGLSESLYRELEGQGVGVSCLCPNLVKTKIFESERNRDDSAEPLPSQTATIAPLREAIAALGIPPDKVSGDVVEAIKQNRFWILTHETTHPVAQARFRDLSKGSNPSDPYEVMNEDPELTGFFRSDS